MKKLIASVVLVLTLTACTTTSYEFVPEKKEDPKDVECGSVSYVKDKFFTIKKDSLGRFCLDEER